MLERIKSVGWKKICLYIIIVIFLLIIFSFVILFGTLLLMDKYDDRYDENELTLYNAVDLSS
ncbi:hypothetical protein [Gracilibacillus lacisalsi]|uniref:hypothetical protein n=1 Tax=Gracilibacillus lacisalsi TaxID=393087 RepID=UPI0003649195|nr:hypothetical protein [Gracilibacillus lacisalsi]